METQRRVEERKRWALIKFLDHFGFAVILIVFVAKVIMMILLIFLTRIMMVMLIFLCGCMMLMSILTTMRMILMFSYSYRDG